MEAARRLEIEAGTVDEEGNILETVMNENGHVFMIEVKTVQPVRG